MNDKIAEPEIKWFTVINYQCLTIPGGIPEKKEVKQE
jgi:hypothetical protein